MANQDTFSTEKCPFFMLELKLQYSYDYPMIDMCGHRGIQDENTGDLFCK